MTTKQATLEQTLNYQPVMPRFGTSGVRALVSDLTDLEIYCLTLGTLRYLESVEKLCIDAVRVGSSLRIPIAGDLRESTDRLLGATTQAIQDAGYDIDYLGKIPTLSVRTQFRCRSALIRRCTNISLPITLLPARLALDRPT